MDNLLKDNLHRLHLFPEWALKRGLNGPYHLEVSRELVLRAECAAQCLLPAGPVVDDVRPVNH